MVATLSPDASETQVAVWFEKTMVQLSSWYLGTGYHKFMLGSLDEVTSKCLSSSHHGSENGVPRG